MKHAHPSKVSISITRQEDDIVIRVQDDGVGFDPGRLERDDMPDGFGLFSIRLRLQEIGGTFIITSQPGQGCQVILKAPVKMNEKV